MKKIKDVGNKKHNLYQELWPKRTKGKVYLPLHRLVRGGAKGKKVSFCPLVAFGRIELEGQNEERGPVSPPCAQRQWSKHPSNHSEDGSAVLTSQVFCLRSVNRGRAPPACFVARAAPPDSGLGRTD